MNSFQNTMIYDMCFDGSVVRGWGDEGRPLYFSNTRATGHVRQMEYNYSRARAMGLKAADPTCLTAMSEPWGWGPMPYPDQGRPFATVLGQEDDVARPNHCETWQQGHDSLLDIVGLNIYFDNGIPQMLAAARQLFPGKKVVVAETANTYRPDCHPPALWWAEFETLNEPDLEVRWNPGLTMLTHERGERMDGNLLSEDGTLHRQKP